MPPSASVPTCGRRSATSRTASSGRKPASPGPWRSSRSTTRSAMTSPPSTLCAPEFQQEKRTYKVSWAERFWKKVDRTPTCWLWTACRKDGKYGFFCVSQERREYSHRLSWELSFGAIPKGMSVLHKCDNVVCVRPDHLFLGTLADNNADMKAKGRHAYGERSGRARLTTEDVKLIRVSNGSDAVIASEFGVSQSAISLIRNRLRWAHV